MRVEIGSEVSKMSSKELKRDLLVFARNNPDLFLELAHDENVHLRIGRATAIINKIVRDLKEQEINLEEYYGSMNYETTE